jgi:hypothetical protein
VFKFIRYNAPTELGIVIVLETAWDYFSKLYPNQTGGEGGGGGEKSNYIGAIYGRGGGGGAPENKNKTVHPSQL